MKIKNIISVLLVAAMVLSMALLVSCNDENEKETETNAPASDNGYTLTILDNNGAPVSGASVLFFDGTYKQATTDADGKATVELTGESVPVSITSVPSGCEKPEATIEGSYHGRFEAGKKELTLTVERISSENATYTVNVVDQNGDPVEGAMVQVCHGSICESAKPTDASGKMTIELAGGLALDVKLSSLPDGYTAPEVIKDGGYHATMEAGSTEITVTVTKGNQ